MSTAIEYRLRIRNAADSADAIVITSTRGGTNPYLASSPNGDGSSFNPLTAASIIGAYTGTIADWSIGSMQRVLTSQLEDANSRQQLGYRKAYIEYQEDGGGFTNVLIAGRLTLLRLTDAMTWEYTVTDPMQAQTVTRLFSPASSMSITDFLATWPNRGCILGGPVMTAAVTSILGIQDLGGWQMKIETTGITGEYILRPVKVYGPPRWNPESKIEDVADVINDSLVPFQGAYNNGAQSDWTSIRDTQTNYWAWNGVTVLIDKRDGNGFKPWKPLQYNTNIAVDNNGIASVTALLVSTRKGDTGIKVKSDGTRSLTNGSLVRVRVLTVLPTDTCPIYIAAHPVDVLTTLWDAASISYSSADCATLKSALGSDAYIALRITESAMLADLVLTVCKPWGIGIRANASAQLVPFQGRVMPNTPPAVTITSADVVDGSTSLPFELDPSQAVQTMRFSQKRFSDQRNAPLGTPGSLVDGVIVSDDEITLINGDTTAIPYGQFDLDVAGMVHTANATYPVIEAFATAIARTIFDRFGHGPVALETTLIRNVTTDAIKLGDEILVNLPQLPNHNYRLGDNPAIAARAMQVVRRTVLPHGYAIRLLDSGPNAQPLPTVPVLTVAASVDAPRTVASVTITNAAALNLLSYGARLQMATTTNGSAPASTQYTDVRAWEAGSIPTTAFRLSPLAAGTTVYVRARSEGVPTSRPSNFGTAVGVTLSDVNNPSGLVASPSVTDGSLCVLTWTPGAGTTADLTDIWLRLSTDAFTSAVRQVSLNPGSNRYTLERLTPGTAYKASVQHRDPRTNDVSDPVDVSFTAGATTRTLAAPVYPFGFAGSLDEHGAPQRDGVYGMAVIAAEVPGFVEVSVAVETAVASGAYGAFTAAGTVASVSGAWTLVSFVAPNDGLRRQLKARHVADGATSSSYSSTVTVTPWTPSGLPGYPTDVVCEATVQSPSSAGVRVLVKLTGVDPAGQTVQVRVTTLSSNMSIGVGTAVGTLAANNSNWDLVLPTPGGGPGSGTFEAVAADGRSGKTSMAFPEQTTLANPQGTVAVDSNGNWQATVDGPANVLSFKYATSTSAFPADAVAAAGTLVSTGRNFSASGGPLTFGQTIFITIIPYTGASATGTTLPSIRIRGAYLTYTASKTITYAPSGWTDLVDPATVDYTQPLRSIYGEPELQSSPGVTQQLEMALVTPDGVTLTNCALNVGWPGTHSSASSATFEVYRRTATTQSHTSIGSQSIVEGSQTTSSFNVSESTTSRHYQAKITVVDFQVTSGLADLFIGGVALTFSMPDPAKTI